MEGAAGALKIIGNSIGPATMVAGAPSAPPFTSFRVLPDTDHP